MLNQPGGVPLFGGIGIYIINLGILLNYNGETKTNVVISIEFYHWSPWIDVYGNIKIRPNDDPFWWITFGILTDPESNISLFNSVEERF